VLSRLTISSNTIKGSKLSEYRKEGEMLSSKGHGIRENAIWALIVPVIILGGIYGGVFTPTEAAGVAVVYALVISLYVYRNLKWKDMWAILLRSSVTSVVCLVMVVMASSFGRLLTLQRVPVDIANFIISISHNPVVVLILINIMLLIAGMFMETIALIIILTPILLPIVTQVGVDPIHFGVIMTVNLAIGFCTPPLGANLFIATGVAEVRLEDLIRKIVPFIITMIVMLMMVTFIPQLSMWLPSMME
jgi:C4-dicarboxylate transporter DctM subunit